MSGVLLFLGGFLLGRLLAHSVAPRLHNTLSEMGAEFAAWVTALGPVRALFVGAGLGFSVGVIVAMALFFAMGPRGWVSHQASNGTERNEHQARHHPANAGFATTQNPTDSERADQHGADAQHKPAMGPAIQLDQHRAGDDADEPSQYIAYVHGAALQWPATETSIGSHP